MTILRVKKLLPLFALLVSSCAPLQPVNPGGPRSSEATYPIRISADNQRREIANAALGRLNQPPNATATSRLNAATSTIENLALDPSRPLYLPKLGIEPVMNEEETRESLRRFIREWHDLIGADPEKLSLIERVDQPDGTKTATYEHRPFRYPIRGRYGKLDIRFTNDRRVLNLSSTCIPDAERIQTALSAITVHVQAPDVVTRLRSTPVTYKNETGTDVTFSIPSASEINVKELVTYILPSKENPEALEFHVAWEVEVTGTQVRRLYIDAVNGDPIAAE